MSAEVVFPPTTVPERTLSFLKKFFHLLDDETPEGAEEFGHMFTEDASYHLSPKLVYHGRPGKLYRRRGGDFADSDLNSINKTAYMGMDNVASHDALH